MKLKDIMTPHVECLKPDDSLAHAAQRMRDLDVGSLPICGMNERLTGIITDRDITVRGTAAGCDPETTRVADIMTQGITYCSVDDSLDEAASLMEEKQIRRLAVLDGNKRLVGIVSLGDLAVKGNDAALSAEALEQISEPVAAAM